MLLILYDDQLPQDPNPTARPNHPLYGRSRMACSSNHGQQARPVDHLVAIPTTDHDQQRVAPSASNLLHPSMASRSGVFFGFGHQRPIMHQPGTASQRRPRSKQGGPAIRV
ncbi:hypothetical protein ACLOJK_035150 [Asimina triloba]